MELHHPQLRELADELYDFSAQVFYKRKSGQGRGIVLYGENGSGKTHAARQFQKWFNHVRMSIGPVLTKDGEGQDEAMIADSSFVMWPQVVDGFKQDQWLICDRLQNDYLAVIDDVGAEHDPSRIGMEKLYLILSRREFKYTIITTNISPYDWQTKFERRVASRLFRNFTHIDLSFVPDFSTRPTPQ